MRENGKKSVFAVKDMDISALHIFLSSDEENAIDLMKATDMKEAEGMALLRADVDIK